VDAGFTVLGLDLEISPEPTETECRAIVEALRLEAEEERAAQQPPRSAPELDDPYATAPPRQSRGATRA
jgi:hypothetical protein